MKRRKAKRDGGLLKEKPRHVIRPLIRLTFLAPALCPSLQIASVVCKERVQTGVGFQILGLVNPSRSSVLEQSRLRENCSEILHSFNLLNLWFSIGPMSAIVTPYRRLQQTNHKLVGDLSLARTVSALEQKNAAAAETPPPPSAAVSHRDSQSGSQCPHHCVSDYETTAGLLVWALNLASLVFFSLKGNENSIFM